MGCKWKCSTIIILPIKNISYLFFLCVFPNAPVLLDVAFPGSKENLNLKHEI